MRLSIVRRGGLAVFAVLGAACGGSSFSVVDGGPEMDVFQSKQDAGPGHDATHADAGSGGGGDAGTPHDARQSIDVASRDGGKEGVDAVTPADTGTDVETPLDSGHDSTPDTGHDAGPPCMTKQALPGEGVFLVSSTSPAVGTCGTLANPCTDLATAMGQLSATGKHTVYISQGTYTPIGGATSFAIPEIGGVTLQGGWNATNNGGVWDFAATCTSNATLSSTGSVVVAIGTAAAPSTSHITFDTIGVQNAATPAAGESLYGIFAVGTAGMSTLGLSNTAVTVPAAGAGAVGAAGTMGMTGIGGGCAQASGGAVGTLGTQPSRGSYSASGLSVSGPTTAGTGGLGATPGPVVPYGPVGGEAAECGPTTCNPDYMGCVKGICSVRGSETPIGTPSNSGCGGFGGTGGSSGQAGGASIALFLWSEDAAITGGSLAAGNGGTGGTGGAGGGGGMGGTGAPAGAAVSYPTECHPSSPVAGAPCVFDTLTYQSLAGEPGLSGDPGGAGGAGAGGVGGDSYSYYANSGTNVTLAGSPMLTFGSAGPGGAGAMGTPMGASGLSGFAGTHNTMD
jgi:hypothetical protein